MQDLGHARVHLVASRCLERGLRSIEAFELLIAAQEAALGRVFEGLLRRLEVLHARHDLFFDSRLGAGDGRLLQHAHAK